MPHAFEKKTPTEEELFDKILGAWYGRICGCLLGKPVEGVKYDELTDFLKCSGNFPMTRYICRKDIDRKGIRTSCLAGEKPYVPWDDDTNYMVLAQILIEKYGKDFTPKNMMELCANCMRQCLRVWWILMRRRNNERYFCKNFA